MADLTADSGFGAIHGADRTARSEPVLRGSRDSTSSGEALRAERERLGFDYGKFDYVIHRGTPVLLDANRTPGNPRSLQEHVKKGALNLAEGLDALLRSN